MTTLTADLRMYRHSGIGRYLRNLFPLLLPLLEVDRVRVLTPRSLVEDNAAWLNDPRVELIDAPQPIYSLGEQYLALAGAYRGSDLLWVPHYNAPLLYTGRMVVTIHDLAPLALPQILGNAIKRIYARTLTEHAARHAAAILTVSEFTAQELRSRLGVPTDKITVTHPGLDAAWPDAAEPHRAPDAVPYLLFVGNVKPNKNLSLLLQAFARVADSLPHRLVLVGKIRGMGTGDEDVLRLAQTMGDRVRFAGEVDDAALIALYAGASAFVMPSLYEGFGLPLLEAMRLGCPVLCSTAGSLPEVAGDAALYFDPHSEQELAERLLAIADQPTMARLRVAGYARVTQFSFDDCAQRTAAVFNRLLHQPR
jgi:glycosyltransferase involved in cell wall biosynthesis